MINKIFLDYDNTLGFTVFEKPDELHVTFTLDDDDPRPYFSIIRPSAQNIINFCRELVGEDSVYILTAATKEYASKINELALFGFKDDKILAREDLANHRYATAYGGFAHFPHKDLAHEDNVLIDDLPPRDNENKISLIGINHTWRTNYKEIRPYYGTNFPNDEFEFEIKMWLQDINSEPPRQKFTCFKCPSEYNCEYRWDLYNTNGDCLALK